MWFADDRRPEPRPALPGPTRVDTLVIGGGYTGLWTAIRLAEQRPTDKILLVEADRIGGAASGRNGGFVSSSITHGLANGLRHWPKEIAQLERLGRENLDGMARDIERYEIDCSFKRVGKIAVAVQPHQVEELRAGVETAARYGKSTQFLTREEVRERVDSPTYLAGVFDPTGNALVSPARLAWGLADAAERLGVTIAEGTPVRSIEDRGDVVEAVTDSGTIRAGSVVLATNAFPSLLKRLSLYTVPVYDYALGTAPLTADQLAAIGWSGREGLTDAGNEFHYYRLTDDNRILWGGYDAVYHYGSRIAPELDERRDTFELLAQQFFETFPQLSGLGIDYAWGGVIDTCTRFSPFFGTALGGKVAYAMGFTGLGVGSTRFAAEIVADLLAGRDTEVTRLKMVRSKPIPWPPEPLRAFGIEVTKRSLSASDHNGGKRNLWLKALDAAGVGFDS
jgi:glycine/D-amino acid oxidase-like deaminating enzyme